MAELALVVEPGPRCNLGQGQVRTCSQELLGLLDSFRRAFEFDPTFARRGFDAELVVKRLQVKDTFSVIRGRHSMKAGGEWIHTRNAQVFRGFFEGRYLFDSVTGFLRYASAPAPGG